MGRGSGEHARQPGGSGGLDMATSVRGFESRSAQGLKAPPLVQIQPPPTFIFVWSV